MICAAATHEGPQRTPFCPRRTRRGAENTEGVADFLCAVVRFCEDQSHFAPANHLFSKSGTEIRTGGIDQLISLFFCADPLLP